jgi:ribosomal-protein-alanine N-acetyltransferase
MELTTERLHLRPFTAADQLAIHAVYADPEVMRHVGHGAHKTIEETAAALRIYGEVLERRGFSFLAVTKREGGALVGDGGLHPLGDDVELGYTLARSAWGRGYATELGRALLRHAFEALKAPRVVAQVEPDNAASRRVLEKLGMTECETRTAYGRPHLLYEIVRESAGPRSDARSRPDHAAR